MDPKSRYKSRRLREAYRFLTSISLQSEQTNEPTELPTGIIVSSEPAIIVTPSPCIANVHRIAPCATNVNRIAPAVAAAGGAAQACESSIGTSGASIGILVEDTLDNIAAPLLMTDHQADKQTDRQTPPLMALISMETMDSKSRVHPSVITTIQGLACLPEDVATCQSTLSCNKDVTRASQWGYKRSRSMFEGQSHPRGTPQHNSTRLRHINTPHFLRQSIQVMQNSRVVLMSQPHKHPFGVFSVIPYNRNEVSQHNMEADRQTQVTSSSNIYIDGLHMGDAKTEVSFANLLEPSKQWLPQVPSSHRRKPRYMDSIVEDTIKLNKLQVDHHGVISTSEELEKGIGDKLLQSRDSKHADIVDRLQQQTMQQQDSQMTAGRMIEYRAFVVDDPELTSGKHRTVLNLPSMLVSVIQYAKPSQVKKDINRRFKEKFPHITITLSKLRSLKREMTTVSEKLNLDRACLACAFVYFEKVVLRCCVNKHNRKLIAGSCVLLACKYYDDEIKETMKNLIEEITEQFRLSTKELLTCELQVLVALEFSLNVNTQDAVLIFKRLETRLS